MSLKLITGPANASKAGAVLGAFRDHAEAGNAPVLVVPTAADRDAYELEMLAGGSALIGGRVVTWEGLVSLLARRVGVGDRLIGPLRRRTLVRKAISSATASLETLGGSAATVGFVPILESLFREVGRAGLDSTRLGEVEFDGEDARRRELVTLLGAYEAELAAAGVVDRERQALAVLDVLEGNPGQWDGRPLMAYGFSEFTVVQRRVISAISEVSEVVVSLPADGRRSVGLAEHTVAAFRRSMGDRVEVAPQMADGELKGPRLLESMLFSGRPRGAAEAAAGSVRVLAGSGTVAAAELVAMEVSDRVEAGVALDGIVIVRPPRMDSGPLVASLRDRGFTASAQQTVQFSATALGAALLGLLRCELTPDQASADDAVAWLGAVADPQGLDLAESIDRELRSSGDRRAVRLLAEWRSRSGARPDLEDTILATGTREQVAGSVKSAARRIFTCLAGVKGEQLRLDQAEQAAALAAVTIAMSDVAELLEEGDPVGMIEELSNLPVEISDGAARPGAVLISDPLSIRGRSFNTVIVCGLEDGLFPASFSPDPFLEDVAAEGLSDRTDRISASEAHAGAEREQFVICAARALELLVLVRRSTDDKGDDLPRSPFIDESMRLLGRDFDATDGTRRAGMVDSAAGERGRLRAEAKAAMASREPSPPGVLGPGAAAAVADALGRVASPTRLEKYSECPAKWLAEVVLSPSDFEEKPEAMELGTVVHLALEAGVKAAIEGGLGPITEANRATVEAAIEASLAASESRLSGTVSARLRIAEARRLVFDWLDWEVERADGWTPERVELKFIEGGEIEPLDLGDGLIVTGSVDRVDVATADDGSSLIVIRDYKSGSAKSGSAAGNNSANRVIRKWSDERFPVFQAPLYLKAASLHLKLPPGGAFYETLRDRKRTGGLAVEIGASASVDALTAQAEIAAAIDQAVSRAKEIVALMVAGHVAPAEDCDCPHPWLCGRRV